VIRTKRSYPPVRPKYKNPEEPFETWSGRGKKPRWLSALLKSGKKLDDFLIQRSA
jgi:DNA-binding protein H-NS